MDKSKLIAILRTRDGQIPLGSNSTAIYDCSNCLADGIEHRIIDIQGPLTDRSSHWGSGLPTTLRQCTACGRQDGPWISADIVGGGW